MSAMRTLETQLLIINCTQKLPKMGRYWSSCPALMITWAGLLAHLLKVSHLKFDYVRADLGEAVLGIGPPENGPVRLVGLLQGKRGRGLYDGVLRREGP